MRITGIDPGANGAIVTIDTKAISAISRANKDIKVIPHKPLFTSFREHVFIEKLVPFVHGKAEMSPVAMCKLYGSYKYLLGLYQAYVSSESVTEVIPMKWQRRVCGRLPKMTYAERKRHLCAVAKKIAADNNYPIKITLTNCDAFLIAYYGVLTYDSNR